MDKIIAYCGLVCSDCPAYIATQANDPEALGQVLERWREEFNAPHITVEDILCDGCQAHYGRLNGYCRRCPIRPCGLARSVPNCAHCDEYVCEQLERLLAVCDNIHGFFEYASGARGTLEGIRTELGR